MNRSSSLCSSCFLFLSFTEIQSHTIFSKKECRPSPIKKLTSTPTQNTATVFHTASYKFSIQESTCHPLGPEPPPLSPQLYGRRWNLQPSPCLPLTSSAPSSQSTVRWISAMASFSIRSAHLKLQKPTEIFYKNLLKSSFLFRWKYPSMPCQCCLTSHLPINSCLPHWECKED